MAEETRKRLRQPLPLTISGDLGAIEGSALWMDGVDVVLLSPVELPTGVPIRAQVQFDRYETADIDVRVLSCRHASTEHGPAWMHDGVYRPCDPSDGDRIEALLVELGVPTGRRHHRVHRQTQKPLSQVGSQAQEHSQSRRGVAVEGDLDAVDAPSRAASYPVSGDPPVIVRHTAGSTEYAVGRHIDRSVSRPPYPSDHPPFSDSDEDIPSASGNEPLEPSPDLRARLADRARAAALAQARRRLTESATRDPSAPPPGLAQRSSLPRRPSTVPPRARSEDAPVREAIRAGQIIRSSSLTGSGTGDPPSLPHRDYQRPNLVVAPGNPTSVQLILQTRDDVDACVSTSGEGVILHAPRHPDLQEDEDILLVVQLPNGAYVQFDARVEANGPLMAVLDASDAPQGRIGPLLALTQRPPRK